MSHEPADGADGDGPPSTADVAATPAVDETRPATDYGRGTTVIARTVARVVVPIILVTAIALLLQGHNQPGGGFIGAVLTATAFVLVAVVFGLEFVRAELIDRPGFDTVAAYRLTFAAGLALAAGSGLVPMLADYPFLTQGVLFLKGVPLYGEFELASAFAFDLGVYFTVVGALLTILAEVGGE